MEYTRDIIKIGELMKKKVIAVCGAKIHDHFRTEFLFHLQNIARQHNYKLLVFTSNSDYEILRIKKLEQSSVFSLINYELIDAAIIISECFHNKNIQEELTERFKSHDIPVMVVHGSNDGYNSIIRSYKEEYQKLVNHLVEKHNARNFFFMAGIQDPSVDPESQERYEFFREVLDKHGIPFEEKNHLYGMYDSATARNIIARILQEGTRLPDAIVCCNDNMAIGVIDELNANNVRVPEDVIVTGFDGVEKSRNNNPRLSTCREDVEDLAQLCIENFNAVFDEEPGKMRFVQRYKTIISESCGCHDCLQMDYRKISQQYYDDALSLQDFETSAYGWADMMLTSDGVLNEGKEVVEDIVFPNSYFSIRDDFIAFSMGTLEEKKRYVPTNKLMIYSTGDTTYRNGNNSEYSLKQMVPDYYKWLEDETMFVICDVSMENEFIGTLCTKVYDINAQVQKLARLSKIVNIVMNATVNKMRKMHFKESALNGKYVDSFTGLPNYLGVDKWFAQFAKNNNDKLMSVSIYDLPDYKFIMDNYGLQEIAKCLNSVAEALKIANAKNGYIGKISDNQFIVINWVSDDDKLGMIINEAVRVFFNCMDGINQSTKKDYYLEVNCGCTVVNPGWQPNLTSFVKFATAELYKNRISPNFGYGSDNPDYKAEHVDEIFETLLEKNLFIYHFQPIFEMKTQKVYAFEALMRTPKEIGMNPEQILKNAERLSRIYDIEKATMFNVMEQYLSRKTEFNGVKVFINSIPGFFLTDEDQKNFANRYRSIIESMVVEITEQDSLSDEELKRIKSIGGNVDVPVALDDYGTGHSNIVNLMRYKPQYVKIDRYLITNIDEDTNKRMFVKNTIEFAHLNDMMVLAEGVETKEEMETVVSLGVDLVQGYYTGRPSPTLKLEMDKEIAQSVAQIRKQYFDFD